jgi:hypothetical protein
MFADTAEQRRLAEIHDDATSWRRWGPYLSDRSWATVREDYSPDGNAWAFLPHDLARSKAYRWGDDGIAGICDRYQLLCFAPAFWNRRDPILKERLFGLTPLDANHGEDVKEYYFYLDNLPSHAYMKFLYKYPQAEFPYRRLEEENRRLGGKGPEFELLDTGIFDDGRYFDIVIEYAKATPEDLVVRIEAFNRGRDPAPLDILPQLWFRNIWSWRPVPLNEPVIRRGPHSLDGPCLLTDDTGVPPPPTVPCTYRLGCRTFDAAPGGELLFTNNETHGERVFGYGNVSRKPYVKDAFHRYIVNREQCISPEAMGTKAAIHYRFDAIPPGGSAVVRLRLSDRGPARPLLSEVDAIVEMRRREADEFYETIHPRQASADERRIQRQALAGLLWSKQSYLFDVNIWLVGDDPRRPPPASRHNIRNQHWRHLNSLRVMSVPDKWEYPWFASWDLAFHCVGYAMIDHRYAMDQLWLLLHEQFQHPSGQIPAYEWEFSDTTPPVEAWAVWRVYNMARIRSGRADRGFLERCFHKLLMNFAWWVNKLDRVGNNVFEGGFLGMDNITVIDRSDYVCADGAVLEQSDGSGWMGMFCLNMMRMALELARENPVYEGLATKFFQHYVYVAAAMKKMGDRAYALWDDKDGFFYDVLRRPDGSFRKFRVRSMVGLVPLFAVERLERAWIEPFTDFEGSLDWFLRNRRELVEGVVHTVERNGETTHVLTVLNESQLVRILERVWDPAEFLSDYGVRTLSRAHAENPFVLDGLSVGYDPAEAISKIKGGNSNWRGPIWFPPCFLLIESFRKLAKAFGPDFALATKGSGGKSITFGEMARSLAERLISIFARDPATGRRPLYGEQRAFQDDAYWRDLILFYEYFHGDHGAGLGASHQTGWTALVASLIDEWREH